MRFRRVVQLCMSGALVIGLTVLTIRAQSATQPDAIAPDATQPAAPAARVTPDARVLLDRLRDSYAKLSWLDLTGNVSINFDGGGQQRNDHASFTGAFRAPNKFRHDMKNETTIVSTGGKLFTYLARKNAYMTDDAPKTRSEGLPPEMIALLMDQDPSLALAVSTNASDLLLSGFSDASVGESKNVDGITYPSIKLASADEDQTVLIDPKTNLIHSVQHDLRRSMKRQGVPNVKTAMISVDYVPAVENALAQNVSFDWAPPADAKPLAAPAEGPGDGAPAGATVMEGKAAPDFTLKGLDGKSVTLSSLKGSVVVLDFWATWCGPCREALPHIDKVAKDRAGDGVKVYGVDVQDDAAAVAAFVQQANLTLPMLLDLDGNVSHQYFADQVVPETIFIDKNGIIVKAMVGASRDDEEKAVNDGIDAALKAK